MAGLKKPTHNASIRTIGELAALVNRDKSTISRWIRRPDWRFGAAPWRADKKPAILRWAAEHLAQRERRGGKESNPRVLSLRLEKLQEEIRKLRAQADTAETALSKERGDLHDADACEEEAVRRATLFRNGVQNIPSQVVSLALSQGMPHEAAPQFQKCVDELVAGCLRSIAGQAVEESGSK